MLLLRDGGSRMEKHLTVCRRSIMSLALLILLIKFVIYFLLMDKCMHFIKGLILCKRNQIPSNSSFMSHLHHSSTHQRRSSLTLGDCSADLEFQGPIMQKSTLSILRIVCVSGLLMNSNEMSIL